jgi:protease-4
MGEVVRDIAAARRLTPEAVRAAMDRAPVPAGVAAASGLCDGVCYEDELPARLGTMGRPAALVPWPQVQRRLPVPYRWRAHTAVIGVVELRGAIVTGESRETPVPVPLVGGTFAGADTIGRAFRAAERSRRVRAVVFHVDSRGGSALASDLIWREVGRLSRTKPVVVFMGDVAGSGGYYVSCGAGRIVAQPATITGSIGVVGGKLTAHGLFTQLGLTREIVARGDAATMDSAFAPFSDGQLVRVRQEIETIYRRFIATVSTGRRRPEREIEGVAGGRIWTGRQALERGLVDELGDFSVAVLRARELAGIPPSQSVVTRTIVPPRSALTPVYPPAAPGAVAAALDAAGAVQDLLRERALLIMPEPDLPV